MANPIVVVNVAVTVAPTPATLQQTGAFVSQGGTTLAPGVAALLTQFSDLTPLLRPAAANTSITWTSNVATVTTTSPHGLPVGEVIHLTILEDMCLGRTVADAVIILGSVDIVLGEVDR